jgi:hypothetical protein
VLKKTELENEEKKASLGINIHSLIHEQKYKISLVEEKISMFLRYLDTFYTHHSNYLNRLLCKLKLMNQLVNEDINLKQNFSLQIKSTPKVMNDIGFVQLSSSPKEPSILAGTSPIVEYDYDENAKPEML